MSKQTITALITLFTLSITACKGEKYKRYEEQQKLIDQAKKQEALKKQELNSVDVSLLEGVIGTEGQEAQDYLYSLEKDKSVAITAFQKFEELLPTQPVEAAKHLTVALNPWSENLVKGDISSSSNVNIDMYGILTSSEIESNVYKVFGNRTQQVTMQMGLNLLQGKIRESGNITADSKFKLIMSAFLLFKKSELEVKKYMNAYLASNSKEGSKIKSINKTLSQSKRYLELALSLTKYILSNDKADLEKLSYAYKYEPDPKIHAAVLYRLDIFATDSDQDMMSFILGDQTDLLNASLNLLEPVENTESLTNQEILELVNSILLKHIIIK